MLKYPYAGPMMLTRGRSPSLRARGFGARPFFGPYCVQSQSMARLALCHWSSSMVRGKNLWIPVSSGVTPPPIISAIDPVTTTLGSAGSSVL